MGGGGGVKTLQSSISDGRKERKRKRRRPQTSAAASKGKRQRISLDAAIVVATDAPVCEDPAKHSITPVE